jgi:hypothetical protein
MKPLSSPSLLNLIGCISAVATAISLAAHARDEPVIPRSAAQFERQDYSYGTSVQRSEFERLVPNTFWPPPPDVQEIVTVMQAAGPLQSDSWQAVERAYSEFAHRVEALAARLDEFEQKYPAQYFINYPPIKPREVRDERQSLRFSLIDAAEEVVESLRQSRGADSSIDPVIDLFSNYVSAQLRHDRPATRLTMLPDLMALVYQESASPSPQVIEILRAWRDESVSLLKRWHQHREEGHDQWQAGLAREELPEPPHQSDAWPPEERAAAIALYRKCMTAAHRDACELIQRSFATMEQLLACQSAEEARRIRLLLHQRFTAGVTPLQLLRRELDELHIPKAATPLVEAWDRADWEFVKEATLIATRDPEPYWPFHHHIEPMRPEMADRYDDVIRRRESAAATVLAHLQGMRPDLGNPPRRPPERSPASMRRESYVLLVPPPMPEGLGANDRAIRSAPRRIDAKWVQAVQTALGPVTGMTAVTSLAQALDESQQAAQNQMAHHQDKSWLFECDAGYRFDPYGAAQSRVAREDARLLIVNAERALLDELDQFAEFAHQPERIRLFVGARRASEHRMVEASRHQLAPRDPAVIIEPLSALVSLELSADIEAGVWRETEHAAEGYVHARRGWLAEVVDPILDYYDARSAAVWRRNDETAGKIQATANIIHAIHDRHSRALGDSAIALMEQIEAALSEADATRFRRAVLMQICPSVWGVEPTALRQLRTLHQCAATEWESSALSAALREAERADASIATQMMRILGAFDAAPAWKSPTDLTMRILIRRRADGAEVHLAKAMAHVSDASRLD